MDIIVTLAKVPLTQTVIFVDHNGQFYCCNSDLEGFWKALTDDVVLPMGESDQKGKICILSFSLEDF